MFSTYNQKPRSTVWHVTRVRDLPATQRDEGQEEHAQAAKEAAARERRGAELNGSQHARYPEQSKSKRWRGNLKVYSLCG